MKVTEKNQPLFISKMQGNEIYLPSELCCFDGLPEEIRQNKMKMKSLLHSCQIEPNEKYNEI